MGGWLLIRLTLTPTLTPTLNLTLTLTLTLIGSLLVGLHTCGDLAPASIRTFSRSSANGLISIGCCYRHLTTAQTVTKQNEEPSLVFIPTGGELSSLHVDSSLHVESSLHVPRISHYMYRESLSPLNLYTCNDQ